MEVHIDTRQFESWRRQLKAFRDSRPGGIRIAYHIEAKALSKAGTEIKRVMKLKVPVRTGKTRKDIRKQVVQYRDYPPILAVGADKRPGKHSFKLNFLDLGTVPRHTKKGYWRGQNRAYRIGERTTKSSEKNVARIFQQEWGNQFLKWLAKGQGGGFQKNPVFRIEEVDLIPF